MKNTTHIRVKQESKEKLERLARELSYVQNKKVDIPELVRRTVNIPTLKDVLMEDADLKRRMEKK